MTAATVQPHQEPKSLSILQRLAEKDQTAVKDCVDVYGNLIWTLALKFTHSRTDAETAVQAIFMDIWRCAERAVHLPVAEKPVIALIARRRLFKLFNEKVKSETAADMDDQERTREGADGNCDSLGNFRHSLKSSQG